MAPRTRGQWVTQQCQAGHTGGKCSSSASISDRLLWDQLWPSSPEVSLWEHGGVQLQHTKAPPIPLV